MAKQKYYAFFMKKTGEKGILDNWEECKSKIDGKPVIYKSFTDFNSAKKWLEEDCPIDSKTEKLLKAKSELKEGVYFDAGTGRGIGVEVRVTDSKGKSLLPEYYPHLINEHENIVMKKGSTNNYGELIGLYMAIQIACKLNIKKIFGDSELVIKYWSKGIFNETNLYPSTVAAIQDVIKARDKFELKEGMIEHISGDINPSDLGFHK